MALNLTALQRHDIMQGNAKIAQALRWLPVVLLPAAAVAGRGSLEPWVFMGALALAVFAGCKWLTWRTFVAKHGPTAAARSCGYLWAWPGMNPQPFLDPPAELPQARLGNGSAVLATIGIGAGLVWLLPRLLVDRHPYAAGWAGMAGVVLMLHFGLFRLLAVAWQRAGVRVAPIMNSPLRAASLAEFWGRRWNLAFRDLAHTFVFRPLVPRFGAASATCAAFLASGLVHDAVISLPAGGGYGRPTAYFLIQALGVLLERSRLGRRIGLGRRLPGRLFTILVLTLPLPLAFHRPFIQRVVWPMLRDWGALPV